MSRVLVKNCQLYQYNDTYQYQSYNVLHDAYIDINNCKIINIGKYIDIKHNNMNEYDKIIDCNNQLVISGMIDSHIHVSMLGESKNFLNLKSCRSIEDIQDLLRLHCYKHQDISWIIGINWDQTDIGRYPNRYDIDSICNDRPVFLWRACWHIGVANTLALEKANIFQRILNSDKVIGGVIDVNENNIPTGILKERAVELITSISSIKSDNELENFIIEGLDICKQYGLTSVQTNDESSLHIYKKLEKEKKLPIRVFLTPNYSDLYKDTSSGGLINVKPLSASILCGDDIRNIKLTYDRIKIFSDGSLGAETAAIRKVSNERTNDDDYSGVLIFPKDILVDMMMKSMQLGFRLEVHAIGDAAAEKVLDAFEEANVTTSDRPILTHCQVLGADLIEKMKRLGAIANVQPSFVPTDMKWVQNRLSLDHQKYSYAWKTLLEHGIVVAGGSDAPIESASPLIGLYDAIHRRNNTEVFRPTECLSFAEALWTYTVGGAIAGNCENILGNLKVGYIADMVVLDAAVLEDHSLLSSTTPIMTIVNGEVISDSGSHIDSGSKLEGPYIPGKNGLNLSRRQVGHLSCACIINGKFCSSMYALECSK